MTRSHKKTGGLLACTLAVMLLLERNNGKLLRKETKCRETSGSLQGISMISFQMMRSGVGESERNVQESLKSPNGCMSN